MCYNKHNEKNFIVILLLVLASLGLYGYKKFSSPKVSSNVIDEVLFNQCNKSYGEVTQFSKGIVLVEFKKGTPKEDIDKLVKELKSSLVTDPLRFDVQYWGQTNVYGLEAPVGGEAEFACKLMASKSTYNIIEDVKPGIILE